MAKINKKIKIRILKRILKNELLNHNNVYIILLLIGNYVTTNAFSFFLCARSYL